MKQFVGRKKELALLKTLDGSGQGKLVVIRGRRRTGKSRLAREFGKDRKFLEFAGLPPTDSVTAQDQRNIFASKLAENLQLPPLTFNDWYDAFLNLSHHIDKTPTVILLDEISWMGSKDPTFLPKLKVWWDTVCEKHPNLVVIICGSVSTWIEKNIINSTAFFGRISLSIDLEPLSLPESGLFLNKMGFKGSNYEIFKILSILGGIPWYLERINPRQMADANIRQLCFEKDSLLLREFDLIFHDLFNEAGSSCKKIIHILTNGMKTLEEIRQSLNFSRSGVLSTYMKNLITSGFVTQYYQWSLKTERLGKQSLYRLTDLYSRFYIKYIERHRLKIKRGTYENMEINKLPGWEGMMGLQVESLLLQNRPLLLKSLEISAADVVADNPYNQSPTARKKGCQVDYLIQTRTNNLFVCEFKFMRREIGVEIIEEVKEKIRRLSVPRGHAVVPVLFHLGGVSDLVHDKDYFYRVVDIGDFLTQES